MDRFRIPKFFCLKPILQGSVKKAKEKKNVQEAVWTHFECTTDSSKSKNHKHINPSADFFFKLTVPVLSDTNVKPTSAPMYHPISLLVIL